jgi:hypothetical protein
MAHRDSDTEHSPSNYSGSYPSLSDSASSLHHESTEFGFRPRQPHAAHGSGRERSALSLPLPVSNPSPQIHSLQEYAALEKDHRELERKHLLLETQHNTLRLVLVIQYI